MKFVLALTTLAAVASAQQVKACDGKAQACLDTATTSASSCKLGDWYCGCQPDNHSKIQAAATNCVIEACGGAAGALAVISEVQGICEEALKNPPKTEEPQPTSKTPEEPTESSKAPEPTSKTPEEPKPTASGTASAEPSATGNGTTPEKPKPTGEKPPQSSFPTAGAGAIAPAAALVLGLFAFAL